MFHGHFNSSIDTPDPTSCLGPCTNRSWYEFLCLNSSGNLFRSNVRIFVVLLLKFCGLLCGPIYHFIWTFVVQRMKFCGQTYQFCSKISAQKFLCANIWTFVLLVMKFVVKGWLQNFVMRYEFLLLEIRKCIPYTSPTLKEVCAISV